MVESSPLLRPWRARLALAIGLEMERAGWQQVTGPVRVHIDIVLPSVGRPLGDADKLARAVLDSLSRVPIGAGAIRDDSQLMLLGSLLTVSPSPPHPDHPSGAARITVAPLD